MDFLIRLAQTTDLSAVQDLNYELFVLDNMHLNDLQVNWPYEAVGEQYFRDRIAGEGGVCFVAETKQGIVGYVCAGWSSVPTTAYKGGKRAEPENICVAAAVRDHGIGAQLVQAVYTWAKEQSAEAVMVAAYTANSGALHFYEQQGFTPYTSVLWHKL